MATTSLWPIRNTGRNAVKAIIKRVVEYAENEEKTKGPVPAKEKETSRDPRETLQSVMSYVSDKNEGLKYVTGINCTADRAVEEMMITKARWPDRGNRVLYHGYQSFLPGEVTPEQAHRIGVRLASELWSECFEVVVATHLDREHLHNHFVINAMSFVDGTKFIWDEEYPRMMVRSDELCREENLSVVPPNKDNEATRHKGAIHAGLKGSPTIESIVKEDVDSCIAAASSLQEWFQLMKEKGYRVDDSRKYLRVFPYGHSKCIRIDRRFGPEYSIEGLEEQIQSHGLVTEQEMQSEKEQEKALFQELSREAETHNPQKELQVQKSKTSKPFRKNYKPVLMVHKRLLLPVGIQITYIRFIIRMGYRKSPAQIARIHYLYREELTKLDRYIAEAKFLIYEDIHTEKELQNRLDQETKAVHEDGKEVNRLLYRMKSHPEEKETILTALQETRARLKEEKRTCRYCKDILKRMGEMQRKEEMVERILDEGSVQRVIQEKDQQNERDMERDRTLQRNIEIKERT